ncbi:MAG: very short patch repair endonuclease [Rhizomicrobium sp.]
MPDIFSPQVRSRMMSGIRGKNTKPELLIRKALHAAGFRYRLHVKDLPGKPDIVLPRYNAVIFVHGCFWHGHDCHLFRWPRSREEFWQKKLAGNRANDAKHLVSLREAGWRVLTIWECSLKGKTRLAADKRSRRVIKWLQSRSTRGEIAGRSDGC